MKKITIAIRITSYNVCYTKLLRYEGKEVAIQGDIISLIASLYERQAFIEATTLPSAPIIVITSYSIHYTKLYEKQ